MNAVAPIYIEKLFIHPNGTTFKVLTASTPQSGEIFALEYPNKEGGEHSRLIKNKIKAGITPNFLYKLEINGVGYRAWIEGAYLLLNLGNGAVPYKISIPSGIKVEIKKNGVEIEISGKWLADVSNFACTIRNFRPAHKDKYKHKGITGGVVAPSGIFY